jgi:hypothetical protein
MENKVFLLILNTLIFCLFFSCGIEKDSDSIDSVITKFDAEKMAQEHLTDYYLVRKRALWKYGREFVYSNNDTINIFITVGLYQSDNEAENNVNTYLNNSSAVWNAGMHQGESIGNKFWWLAPFQDSSILTNIIFIRKNASFIMSSHTNEKLKELAKKIDNDIINHSDYIDLDKTIQLPVIDSITASKTVLKEGDIAKITVHASDPNNEILEYDAIGVGNYEPDPENVFTEIITRDYVGEPFYGSHVYDFVVINESNVVSEVANIELLIVE